MKDKFKSFRLFFKAIANTKHEMWVSVQVLIAITIVLAFVLWAVEYSVQPDVYSNPLETFLWASMQYVGDPGHFAESQPITVAGRIIAVLVGIIGIAIFAVPAGIIGSGFIDAISEDRKEQKLNEASVVLHKSFRRKEQSASWYTTKSNLKRMYTHVPRYLSLVNLQVKTGMSVDDIIATVDYCPDMRLVNLASAEPIADKPQDRLVVQHFPLNKEYGCCIDRGSDVTIVAPAAATHVASGNMAFSIAAMGGFNYVSKEIEPCPDEPYNFFSMFKDDLKRIGDYDIKEKVESQALHFMDDLKTFKENSKQRNRRHWFIFILGTLKTTECQLHFWRLATDRKNRMENRVSFPDINREFGSMVLKEDEECFLSIFQEINQRLQVREVIIKDQVQNIVSELDNNDRWKGILDPNIMVRMGGGIDCNAFSLRIAYDILVYCNTHLLIAKDIADTIKKHIEPEHVIDDKAKMCFLKEGDGFADGFVKEDEGEFIKSPKLLKENMDRMNKDMLGKYEKYDLNWKLQADYAEHHKPSWLKRLLGRK